MIITETKVECDGGCGTTVDRPTSGWITFSGKIAQLWFWRSDSIDPVDVHTGEIKGSPRSLDFCSVACIVKFVESRQERAPDSEKDE